MSNIQKTLNESLRKILCALIRTLLRNGMAYGEFDQIARKCYVDVAYQHFSSTQKKQTVSNVAILTGLNRKEVKKLHELDTDHPESKNRPYNRNIRVIGGWINDLDYLRADGTPDDLDYEGETSFASLVRKYSGDIPVVAMQKSLLKSGNIIIDADNRVRLLSHAYLPSDDPEEKLSIMGIDTCELIETINHNITAQKDNLRFQHKASNHQIEIAAMPAIKQFVQRKGQAFLEEVDLYLSQHESEDAETVELSVSVFYHEPTPEKQEPSS